jgi:LAO/AO transport system kinase
MADQGTRPGGTDSEGHGSEEPTAPAGPGEGPRAGAPRRTISTREFTEGVLAGDRTILSRTITLVESNAPAHFAQAREVLAALLPHAGRSLRIGVTGPPGAGKSTFIDTLGTRLVTSGHRVGVTAVDPSSTLSGGSILGDKTRMERLANDPRAFVRGSPSGGILGGVARKTRETILVLEAAGHDVVLVETVGVGQSETAVRSMVDFFLLMLIPGAGDELQGIKRGILELADAVLVNKADGDTRAAAELARSQYDMALHYLRPSETGPPARAYAASSLTGEGIDPCWAVIEAAGAHARETGEFERRRRGQERDWMHQIIRERMEEDFRGHPAVAALLPELERAVAEGAIPATEAAMRLLRAYRPIGGSIFLGDDG